MQLAVISALLIILSGCEKLKTQRQEQVVIKHISLKVLSPRLSILANAAYEFETSSEKACSHPITNQSLLLELRASWKRFAIAWASVQPFNLGPISDHNLASQIQYWPDAKDFTKHKVDELLSSEQSVNHRSMRNALPLLTGLVALEYILFDPIQSEKLARGAEHQRYCKYLISSAQILRAQIDQTNNAWQNFAYSLSSFGQSNSAFPNSKVVIALLIESLISASKQIKVDKIDRPLGYIEHTSSDNTGHSPQINLATMEWRRSQLADRALLANMETIHSLLFNRKKGLLSLLSGEQTPLEKEIFARSQSIQQLLQRKPLAKLQQSGNSQDKDLLKLRDDVKHFYQLINEQLPPHFGIHITGAHL